MHDSAVPAPAKRAKRIPADEVRVRMLDAARDVVATSGLTVSFDHLPMEEYIKKAGVPRSSVYRIWSTREEFVADLIGEVFSAARGCGADSADGARHALVRPAPGLPAGQAAPAPPPVCSLHPPG